MPLPVLRKHGIITSDRNVVSLNAGKLSYEQRAAIELACSAAPDSSMLATAQASGVLRVRDSATWQEIATRADGSLTRLLLVACWGPCVYGRPPRRLCLEAPQPGS